MGTPDRRLGYLLYRDAAKWPERSIRGRTPWMERCRVCAHFRVSCDSLRCRLPSVDTALVYIDCGLSENLNDIYLMSYH